VGKFERQTAAEGGRTELTMWRAGSYTEGALQVSWLKQQAQVAGRTEAKAKRRCSGNRTIWMLSRR